VTAADMRRLTAVANFATAVACAFDFDLLLAKRASMGRGRGDPVVSARSAWKYPVEFGA